MKTAVTTRALVDSLDAVEPASVVGILAAAEIATSEAAMGECRTRAAELDGNLETAGWDIFEAIGKLADDRQQTAQEILAELREALSSDEHVVGLAPALTSAQARAVRLLCQGRMDLQVRPMPDERRDDDADLREGRRTRTDLEVHPTTETVIAGAPAESRSRLSLSECRALLAELERRFGASAALQIDVSWRIISPSEK